MITIIKLQIWILAHLPPLTGKILLGLKNLIKLLYNSKLRRQELVSNFNYVFCCQNQIESRPLRNTATPPVTRENVKVLLMKKIIMV